jgi:peptidoglycan/LPS O-acetylase OafA/YrhL
MAGYLAGLNWIALEVLLPASFDSLGLGAWLAWVYTMPAETIPSYRRQLNRAALLALPLVLVTWIEGATDWWPPADWLRLGLEDTAWAVLGAWVIDRAAGGVGGAVGRVLSFRPLVYLGRISYGVYLIHLFVPDLLYRLTSLAGLPIRLAIRGSSWSSAQSPSLWRRCRGTGMRRRSIGSSDGFLIRRDCSRGGI